MGYAVTKKVVPLFLLLMTIMTPLCSAESWQLIGREDGTFDVTFTNGKAYDADGKLLYGSDLNLQHHSVTGAILSKVCQAMMDMSTARI